MNFLPENSTAFEIAASEAMDEYEIISPALKTIAGLKYARPLNPTIAPWLINEYGLDQITGFFDTPEHQIDLGRAWQRIRGTPQAIADALGWIGYGDAVIFDQHPGRRMWHLIQAAMGKLPLPDEDKLLADAEYLARLSSPLRSFFWRGYHGYDVRGNTWGRSRLGKSIWGTSSGVRINGGKTVWSHGRNTAVSIEATEEFLAENGLDVTTGEPTTWAQGLTWDTPTLTWAEVGDAVAVISAAISRLPAYLALMDADGETFAFIKCLTTPKVVSGAGGYSVVYDIRTGFGDGAGAQCRSVALSFGGQNAADVQPFRRYLAPDQVEFPDGEQRLGAFPVNLDLKKTIREFFTVSLLIGE